MANTDLVLKMYDLFGKGDMAGIKAEVFHPDMSWTMPGHHPLSGRMEGVDAVIAFFGALFQAGISVDNIHFGELDDGTVVEKHSGHGKIGSEEFLFPTCTTYGIKDGKIYEVRVHTGDQHTVDRYMWTVFKLKGIPARLSDG
jgi:ketosteroid isomerase-like protein